MFQNNLLMGAASISSAGGLTVDNSVRYNDDDSPYLYRTPSSTGNRKTGSISLWYKRGNLGSIQQLFNAGAGDDITFNASDKLTFIDSSGVSYITTQVFRDPSAWGHLLFAWDTTLATAGDRLRIYHNGVEITAFDTETNPSLGDEFEISNTVRQTIGANESNTEEFDGYLSQFYYVDSLQLTPTDFGEFDSNNVWRPIEYTITSIGSDVTLTATGSAVDTVGRSTYTWSSVNIGTVTSDRKVVIATTTDGSDYITAMTVGGEGANFLARSTVGSRYSEIWQIDDPDSTLGTSEDIVITMSGTANGQGMCTFDVKGADSYVYDSFTSTADPLAGTVSVPAGGCNIMIMGVGIAADPSEGFTFTSGLTERFNYKVEASEYGAAGADAFASATDQAISIDIDGTAVGANGICISLSPVGGIGRNGFKLDFADSSLLGLDAAGDAVSTTTYRYLKLDVTEGGASTTYLSLGEMEYYVGATLYPTQTMTADDAPSPLVASASSALQDAYLAFNDDVNTHWLTQSGVLTGSLTIDLGSGNGIAPDSFRLCSPETPDRMPNNFTIQGSNNDSDYTVLATYAGFSTVTPPAKTFFGYAPMSNGNNFISSGLAAADQVNDTPTKNYPTFASNMGRYFTNAVDDSTLSNGNLDIIGGGGAWSLCDVNFIPLNSGKWYFTWDHDTFYNGNNDMGIVNGANRSGQNGTLTYGYHYVIGAVGVTQELSTILSMYSADFTNINGTIPFTTTTSDQTIMAVDIDNLKLWAGVWDQSADEIYWMANDASWSSANVDVPATGTDETCAITGDNFTFYSWNYSTRGGSVDFGAINGGILSNITQPSGFKQLNTANLAEPTILDGTANFQPTLYTGDGSVRNIDQTGNSTFQPDFVWIKNRSAADSNMQIDVARGVTKEMNSDNFAAQTTDANGLTSFDSDGFGLGTGAGGYNDNLENFVAWQWLAGAGAGSANAVGSITTISTSVNTTAGFSISIWAGTDAEPVTIGHGLGVAPKMIIGKGSGIGNWLVGHDSMGWTKATYWDSTAASYGPTTYYWADTAPTSTVFSTGKEGLNLVGQNWVAYCFAEIEGYSRFGSYTGNGLADGTYTYTGFKPAWVMIRKTSGTGNWVIMDSQRSPYNEMDDQLLANTTAAETTGSEEIDFLSNGFKIRTADSDVNTSSGTYIYAAFAEYPFGGDGVTPATAF